ncbi:PREDICTED: odorant receptor 4-like [Eufriesea mexicana]|uniref:odorant receptor 4-like n=1 Tax=Eufriesea mexicana TaxID=516756 RepID=UPI00083BEBC7|nr:PREDICTED: odorant receptor 4-like [Eufriesea mexicana]
MADELTEVKKKFGSLSEYSIQLNRWFLKPIGAWPESSSTTRHEKILSQISIIICWCISLFTIIPALLRLILEKEDLYLKLKAFGPLCHWIVGVFNYAALLLRKDEIRRCIEHIQADWEIITRITDQRIMLKNAKIGRSIAAFTAAFVHSGIVSTCIVLGALKHTIKVDNETINIYTLPCPPYKIQTDTNPTHGIILGSQFLSGFIASSSAVGAFSLATVFASHALGQLDVMAIWINEFVNQSNQEKDTHTHEISVIVEHHLRILNLVEHIEHMMSGICFMETFKCMVGMCMPSYFILEEWSEHNIQNLVTYAMIIVSMTFNIFLVCYIGELLSEQCKKVGDIVYMTNWYQLPDKEILNLVMIISRSSMEIKITAGKLITLSVYTFGNIVKTVFGYLNILRQATM